MSAEAHLGAYQRRTIVPPDELDLATAGTLALEVAEALTSGDLVIDLRCVSFCDSTGLAVLLRARDHMAAGGGRLVLRDPQPSMLRLFEITGVTELFATETTAFG